MSLCPTGTKNAPTTNVRQEYVFVIESQCFDRCDSINEYSTRFLKPRFDYRFE